MRKKQNLASVLGIQKEKWGITMHFSGENAIHCFVVWTFLE